MPEKKRKFSNPLDAEAAFYSAIERSDIDAMMTVWSEDEHIFCIHPGGARITGPAFIRESWSKIFSKGANIRFIVSQRSCMHSDEVAVHTLHENIAVEGADVLPPPVVTTNIYVHDDEDGWRMVGHHASAMPIQENTANTRLMH